MVLLSQFSPTTFQTPKYHAKGRGSTFVCLIKGVQNECGEDHGEINYKLLL